LDPSPSISTSSLPFHAHFNISKIVQPSFISFRQDVSIAFTKIDASTTGFSDLPGELRNAIYDMTLLSDKLVELDAVDKDMGAHAGLNLSMLAVNKQ